MVYEVSGEFCYDTCTPKLSRMTEDNGGELKAFMYNPDVWREGFERQVYDYADDNDEARVFTFLDDYHEGRLDDGNCWPWWQCTWERCFEEEDNVAANGNDCWT